MASKTFYVAPMLLLGIPILFVSTFASASYEEGIQKPNSVVVKGSVFCDTQLSKTAYFLPGALVAVECSISSNRKWKSTNEMISVEGETNEDGEFRVELPLYRILTLGDHAPLDFSAALMSHAISPQSVNQPNSF